MFSEEILDSPDRELMITSQRSHPIHPIHPPPAAAEKLLPPRYVRAAPRGANAANAANAASNMARLDTADDSPLEPLGQKWWISRGKRHLETSKIAF